MGIGIEKFATELEKSSSMISLKERMAAFQQASSMDAFEKSRQGRKTPKSPSASLSTPPSMFVSNGSLEGKRPVKGKVVPNKFISKKEEPQDWKYLHELATNYDQYKLQEAEEKKRVISQTSTSVGPKERNDSISKPQKDIRASLEGIMGGNYTAKADWLNKDWIEKHLVENVKYKSLVFRFNDPKLFKRFDKTDEKNRIIVIQKFVHQLITHPRSNEITRLDLSSCLLPDEFLEELANQTLKVKGLPYLQVLNLESNLIQGRGIEAISKVITNDTTWRYLQVIMLENQQKTVTSSAEAALAQAIDKSPSIVVCSFRLRGAMERQRINNTIACNVDNFRKARREHASKTGTLKERKRNEMERYFDMIAANDSGVGDSVDLIADPKFLALKAAEKTQAGAAFATNTTIKTVKMVKLGLDDNFAKAMGESLAKNRTIEKVILDSNCFTGEGIKTLFKGLGKNLSIVEFQVRHQSKVMASCDEESLTKLLESNVTMLKLGVDTRNQVVKMQLERKTNGKSMNYPYII